MVSGVAKGSTGCSGDIDDWGKGGKVFRVRKMNNGIKEVGRVGNNGLDISGV